MATTTNFGWETPDDTDLVKDGAAAMRTLGNSIDTSFVDLKGGTSGQILSKASNTDLDYTWITNDIGDITAVTAGTGLTGGGTSGAVSLAIDSTVTTLTGTQTLTNKTLTSPVLTTPSISNIDAKGDLLAGTADNTIGRLAVGTNGHVLTADSAETTGLKWAAAPTGKVLQVVQGTLATTATTTSTSLTDTGLSVSITPSSASNKILVIVSVAAGKNAGGHSGYFTALRGSTNLVVPTSPSSRSAAITMMPGDISGIQYSMPTLNWTWLDSPASTSALTYKVQYNVMSGGTVCINRTFEDADNANYTRGVSTITVMEIAA
jgi:hypothetical protein